MDVILAASEKEKIQEVIQRMVAGERGLHTKTVGPIKLVRKSTLPTLLADLVDHDIRRGTLNHIRTFRTKGHEVSLYERRHLQGR